MRRMRNKSWKPRYESLEARQLLAANTFAGNPDGDPGSNSDNTRPTEVGESGEADNPMPSVAGDFDGDGRLDIDDVDQLSQASASQQHNLVFDLNQDRLVDQRDLDVWVKRLAKTWFGDINLDGEFDTGDILLAFQAGSYDTGNPAVWSEGDWNGDGLFNSTDMVVALQDGGFEAGPRPPAQDPAGTQPGDSSNQDPPISESERSQLPSSYDSLRRELGDEQLEALLRENKEKWGNYQGICGTGLVEMQREFPQLYEQFLQAEQALEQWLNGARQDPAEEQGAGEENPADGEDDDSGLREPYDGLRREVGNERLAELLRAHKARWGNYQGICGTALVDMQQNFPQLYQQFLETEQELDDWLNGLDEDPGANEDPTKQDESSTGDGAPNGPAGGLPETYDSLRRELGDEQLEALLRENKKKWGNYQGICGTGLVEMQREFPQLYEHFLQTEQALEQWLNGRSPGDSSNDSSESADHSMRSSATGESDGPALSDCTPAGEADKLPGHHGEHDTTAPDAPPAETPSGDSTDEPTDIDEKPRGESAEFVPDDEHVQRGFEADQVTGLRTLTVRLGGREAGITLLNGKMVITEEMATSVDPETDTMIEFWDFTQASEIQGEMWYPIYILSLSDSPLNMFRRIVESSESVGKTFLEQTFQAMADNDEAIRVLEVKAEHMILLTVVAQFDQTIMPQVGDPLRAAGDHIRNAGEALQRGDWLTAYSEFLSAQGQMALAAIEVLPVPAGKAGKAVQRTASRLADPAADGIQAVTRNLNEAASEIRKAAKQTANSDVARQMNRTAAQLDEASNVSKSIRRIESLGQPRPSNYPVAARDRAAIEERFGHSNVAQLGNRDANNVLVVNGADGKKQVWVRPEYSDYRSVYVDVHGEIPVGFDVDHLQSRTRGAQQGYGYVRLELVNSEVNQAWGRALEKRTVNSGRKGFIEPLGPPPVRSIDPFQWWKLQGITPQDVTRSVAGG